MKKTLLYITLTILFIAGVGFYTKKTNIDLNIDKKQNVEQVEKSVKTIIDFGEEEKISHTEENFKDLSAYDLLVKTAEKNSLEIKIKQYDFGVFIEEIDGRENTNEKAWIYFVNESSATTASDQYKVKEGDLIEWKYTEPEF